jgi:hypothetical protein
VGGWVVNVTPRPLYLPVKPRYPLCRRMGERQGRSGRVWEISPLWGFDILTVQPVASHYTNWAILTRDVKLFLKGFAIKSAVAIWSRALLCVRRLYLHVSYCSNNGGWFPKRSQCIGFCSRERTAFSSRQVLNYCVLYGWVLRHRPIKYSPSHSP